MSQHGTAAGCRTTKAMGKGRPSRREARRLVLTLALFWVLWGCAVLSVQLHAAVFIPVVLVLIGLLAGMSFYATFFRIFRLQPLGLGGFWDVGTRSRAMMKLLSPRWWWNTFRLTEWSPYPLAIVLAALLIGDVVLFVLVASHPPRNI